MLNLHSCQYKTLDLSLFKILSYLLYRGCDLSHVLTYDNVLTPTLHSSGLSLSSLKVLYHVTPLFYYIFFIEPYESVHLVLYYYLYTY